MRELVVLSIWIGLAASASFPDHASSTHDGVRSTGTPVPPISLNYSVAIAVLFALVTALFQCTLCPSNEQQLREEARIELEGRYDVVEMDDRPAGGWYVANTNALPSRLWPPLKIFQGTDE